MERRESKCEGFIYRMSEGNLRISGCCGIEKKLNGRLKFPFEVVEMYMKSGFM